MKNNDKIKVLMVGPDLSVKGGMTSVVNGYYECGLDKKVDLKFIGSVNDKNAICKIIKMISGFCKYLLNVNKYDIVHIHMSYRLSVYRKCLYLRIAKFFGKKVILHAHGSEFKIFYDEECNNKQKRYIAKCFNMSDKIIVLSEEWYEYFKKIVSEDKLVVIYNSISIPKDFKKNIDNKNILFLGKIGDRKGVYDLIDVIEKLSKEYKTIKLFIGGNGEVEKLISIIKERKLEETIQYIGWTTGNKKNKYLKDCSYYILPSYNEGMPMSVLEGMSYKNITLSTYVGGIPKVISNYENGLLFNPGDKEKMYEYFKELFSNKKLRKKLSDNARITTEEKFNIEKVINELMILYKNV